MWTHIFWCSLIALLVTATVPQGPFLFSSSFKTMTSGHNGDRLGSAAQVSEIYPTARSLAVSALRVRSSLEVASIHSLRGGQRALSMQNAIAGSGTHPRFLRLYEIPECDENLSVPTLIWAALSPSCSVRRASPPNSRASRLELDEEILNIISKCSLRA